MLRKINVYNVLRKKTTSKSNPPLTKKPGTIIFASYPEKKVDKRYIDSFWERYFNGKLKEAISKRKDQSVISIYNTDIKILPLSPTVAVTIRKINAGKRYFEIKKYFENKFKEHKLKYSEIVFADIIDYKIKDNYYYIMERIIPSVTALDLSNYRYLKKIEYKNRFSKSFLKNIQKMDIKSLEKMYQDLDIARKEFFKIYNTILKENTNIRLDSKETNTIVIDYNPNTGKFKFGLIDLKGAFSKSF